MYAEHRIDVSTASGTQVQEASKRIHPDNVNLMTETGTSTDGWNTGGTSSKVCSYTWALPSHSLSMTQRCRRGTCSGRIRLVDAGHHLTHVSTSQASSPPSSFVKPSSASPSSPPPSPATTPPPPVNVDAQPAVELCPRILNVDNLENLNTAIEVSDQGVSRLDMVSLGCSLWTLVFCDYLSGRQFREQCSLAPVSSQPHAEQRAADLRRQFLLMGREQAACNTFLNLLASEVTDFDGLDVRSTRKLFESSAP